MKPDVDFFDELFDVVLEDLLGSLLREHVRHHQASWNSSWHTFAAWSSVSTVATGTTCTHYSQWSRHLAIVDTV